MCAYISYNQEIKSEEHNTKLWILKIMTKDGYISCGCYYQYNYEFKWAVKKKNNERQVFCLFITLFKKQQIVQWTDFFKYMLCFFLYGKIVNWLWHIKFITVRRYPSRLYNIIMMFNVRCKPIIKVAMCAMCRLQSVWIYNMWLCWS